jgi:ribosomal protein S18 acetylase RimI-like enzyme
MELTEQLTFDHEDRKRIYEYVERHGEVKTERVERELNIDPRGMRHHLAILRRDGYVEEDGDTLRVTFEEGAAEEHHSEDCEFVIRQARQDDLTGLVGAIRQVAGEGTYTEAETVADVIDHEEVLLRHNELESRMFFVATVDEEVVGWVHVAGSELDKLAHTAVLTVGVLEEYRGHDIGSHLMERGLQWAQKMGYEKLYNSVPATNDTAIEFLETAGWETEATRADHYKMAGGYVDEVMMAYRL